MNLILRPIDPYLALLAVLINLVFAILVMARTSRSTIYLIFFFICISVMNWNLSEFIRYATGRSYWFYLSLISAAFVPTLMFHFIITLVRPDQENSRWSAPAYFSSCLLALISFLSLFYGEIRKFTGDIYWDIAYFLMFSPFFFGGLYMLIHSIGTTQSEDERSRLRYILVADVIGVIVVATDHVQQFNIPVPPLGHLGSVLYSSILAIGLFKHRTAYDVLAQMRKKLEVLSEMAAGIAHEIRNPLTSIKGASEILGDELKDLDHPKCKEYIDIITEEVERLNSMLTNFQYFTRPLKIKTEAASINEIISKTVKLAEISEWKMRIRQELSQDLPMVGIDVSLMKQVFLNLLKNAAQACGPEGELIIRTEYVSPHVKVSISDDGPGIPAKLVNRIFEPFFTTKSTGMGVGLSISKRIIEAHNGRIEAENLLPRGAQFTILLPGG